MISSDTICLLFLFARTIFLVLWTEEYSVSPKIPCSGAQSQVLRAPAMYGIGFSDLVDLWGIRIKSPRSFAHLVRRDHVNRARNADQAARTCERFVYSVVKITRFYDYQKWLTHLFEKFTRCAKQCGLFLVVLSIDCLEK